MHLTAHSDPRGHARYVMRTTAMRTIPDAALPRLPVAALVEARARDVSRRVEAPGTPGIVTARDVWLFEGRGHGESRAGQLRDSSPDCLLRSLAVSRTRGAVLGFDG